MQESRARPCGSGPQEHCARDGLTHREIPAVGDRVVAVKVLPYNRVSVKDQHRPQGSRQPPRSLERHHVRASTLRSFALVIRSHMLLDPARLRRLKVAPVLGDSCVSIPDPHGSACPSGATGAARGRRLPAYHDWSLVDRVGEVWLSSYRRDTERTTAALPANSASRRRSDRLAATRNLVRS